jgi:hypothetical protein
MNLTDERLKELYNPSLTTDERALIRCGVASDLIHRGQHDAACEAFGELWRGIGERPNVEGFDEGTAAEVLLQVGALSGWLGASRLRRAADVAEGVGALANAGKAVLSLIEEHGATKRLTPAEVYGAYLRANRLLKETQDAEDVGRLRACSMIVMRRLADPAIHEKNFSLYGAVQDLEAKLIRQALEASGGSVTKAARILGLPHQTLNSMLKGRHGRLQEKRTPIRKRLRSIIKEPKE